MKTIYYLQKMIAVLVVSALAWSASTMAAQDSPVPTTVQPAAGSAAAPQLACGVPQILDLANAKVGDDTIIAYIKNSGSSYGLNADPILYLRQQGLSDAVITAMLNQSKPAAAAATPTTPAPVPAISTASPEPVSTAVVAPAVTYVQTVPATTCYYYQPYFPVCGHRYYPYPEVSLSLGWGVGWHGGGWHHGWHR